MNYLRILAPLGLLAATAVPAHGGAPAAVFGGSEARFTISGVVPVVCNARVEATRTAGLTGMQPLGTLREFCNSPRGYRVVASHSPALFGAKLMVDGVPVPLSPQGETVVSRSNHAQVELRQLALDLGRKAAPGTISFRIEPL